MLRLLSVLALAALIAPLSRAETIDRFAMTYTVQPAGANPITNNLSFAISDSQPLASRAIPSLQYIVYDNIVVNDDPDTLFTFVYSPRQGNFFLQTSDNSVNVGCTQAWSSSVALSSAAPYLGSGVIRSLNVPGYCSIWSFGTALPVTDLSIVVTQESLIAPPPPPVSLPGAVTPEPNSFALLGTGILGLGTVLRRRAQA